MRSLPKDEGRSLQMPRTSRRSLTRQIRCLDNEDRSRACQRCGKFLISLRDRERVRIPAQKEPWSALLTILSKSWRDLRIQPKETRQTTGRGTASSNRSGERYQHHGYSSEVRYLGGPFRTKAKHAAVWSSPLCRIFSKHGLSRHGDDGRGIPNQRRCLFTSGPRRAEQCFSRSAATWPCASIGVKVGACV